MGSQTRQTRLGSRYRLAGKTSPIRVNAVLRTKACETKPIRPERQERTRTGEVAGGAVAGTGCTNKPNLPARTEMGTGRQRRRRSRRSGRLRQTNPICPAPAGKALLPRPQALPSLGTSAPNEANSRWAGPRGRGPARSPMPTLPGQSVRNKANRSRATRRTSALWRKSYGELGTQKASAKQSQFPHGPRWPRAGKAAGATGGTHRAKQSQFPGSGRRGGPGVHHRMPATPDGRVRLYFMRRPPLFVMLSEAKHLANEWDQRLLACSAQILADLG